LRDLTVTGTEFDEHEGQALHLSSRQGGSILGMAHAKVVRGGCDGGPRRATSTLSCALC
jgi:hypothetical protein